MMSFIQGEQPDIKYQSNEYGLMNIMPSEYGKRGIAFTTMQLILINQTASAAQSFRLDGQFGGGHIQCANKEFMEDIDPSGIHLAIGIVPLAPDHYRLMLLCKLSVQDAPQMVLIDVDLEMYEIIQGPEYSVARFNVEGRQDV